MSNVTILSPVKYWPVKNVQQMAVVDKFGHDLATKLSAKKEKFLIEELWSKTKPAGAGDGTALAYLDEVSGEQHDK
jgi:hypothetical protein